MQLLYPQRSHSARHPWVLALVFAAWASGAAIASQAQLITRPIYPFNGLVDAVMADVSDAWSIGVAVGVLTARTVPQALLTGDMIQADMEAAAPLDARLSPLVGVRIRWRF